MRSLIGFPRVLVLAAPALALLAGLGDSALGQLTPNDSATAPAPQRQAAKREHAVHLRLLGVNDFHGHLQSPASRRRVQGGPRVPVGGASVLGSHLDKAAQELPGRTIRVHAGDMAGATPLASSHFHDEPAVKAMNLMRFDVGTLGNHEFDEGAGEALRLVRGGRRSDGRELKRDARGRLENTSDPHFEGARFPYVAANTVDADGRRLLPPTTVVERAGVKVGVIGVTTDTSSDYLLPRHRAGLRFLDISDTVNRYAARLRRQGVRAIVVLAHAGARGASGEIVDETRQMSDDVDVIVAGHTHAVTNVEVPNRHGGGSKLIVQAASHGTAFDQVDMRVDRGTGEVLSKTSRIPTTWSDEVRPDPALDRLTRHYVRLVAPLAKQVLGRATSPLARPELVPGAGESGLSAIVADAQRELAGADVAFVNPGNMRADLPRGAITYEDLFEVAAFEHEIMRMDLSGADLLSLLAEQASPPAVWLHVSGMRWSWRGGQVGDVVMADGRPLEPRRTYTVAANELLVGTERFSAFARRGRGIRPVGTDLDALVRHLKRTKGQLGSG